MSGQWWGDLGRKRAEWSPEGILLDGSGELWGQEVRVCDKQRACFKLFKFPLIKERYLLWVGLAFPRL